MVKVLSDIGEFGLIDLLRKKTKFSSFVIKGIGDDTAVIKKNSTESLLLTTDMLVENVHFTRKHKPRDIGRKALACSISDIAAMAGIPQYALVSVGLPAKTKIDFALGVYRGITDIANKYCVMVVGGDTVENDKWIVNIALVGKAVTKKIVYRSGARLNDKIFVSGPLGRSYKSDYHFKFIPRVAEAQYLARNFKISSMIDISDGLAADLGHILHHSNRGAILYAENIPLRKKAKVEQALYDGEDFELLFTLSGKEAQRLRKSKGKYTFTEIGEITNKKEGFNLIDKNDNTIELKAKGYVHF